jgi:hypothetical protein
MSLAYIAKRFVDRAFKNPADASDPTLLNQLLKAADEAWEGIVALHAPASPMTWEVRTNLASTAQRTNRIGFRYPRPVEIVGMLPTLVVYGTNGALITPSTDDLMVSIDTDNQNYLTSGEGVSSNAGGTAGPFVTLTAMSVQVPRIMGYKLRNPTPSIGFTFQWAQAVTAAAPVYNDVTIALAMYARYL